MNRILVSILAVVLFFSVGCQRKDLLDPHDHSNIWINAQFDSIAQEQLLSNRSRYARNGEPASTKYIVYAQNTGRVAYTGSFDGIQGGIYLQEGVYDLMLYTSDFNEYDANFFKNLENPDIAETHTRQTKVKEPREDVDEMYIVEPDPTFSYYYKDIVVRDIHEDITLDIELVQKSFKYYLTIKAKGLQNIHTATMYISGMYTSAFLTNDEHRMNEAGIQTVDLEIRRYDYDDPLGNGELYGEFWSFGPNAREDIQNSITLHFINGDLIVMKLKDLTGQIKKLEKGGEIVVEQFLEIKGPAGGFNPGVGDWDNSTDVDLIL